MDGFSRTAALRLDGLYENGFLVVWHILRWCGDRWCGDLGPSWLVSGSSRLGDLVKLGASALWGVDYRGGKEMGTKCTIRLMRAGVDKEMISGKTKERLITAEYSVIDHNRMKDEE